MKLLVLVIGLSVLAVSSTMFAVFQRATDKAQSSFVQGREYPETIKEKVERAKSEGRTTVEDVAPIVRYASVRDLEEALAHYDVVLARLVAQKSYVQHGSRVVTWYKFNVLQQLHNVDPIPCSYCATLQSAPGELLPLKFNEILVPHIGGTVNVDGVTVSVRELGAAPFAKNNKYLLFLLTDLQGKVGQLDLGPNGAFVVSNSGSLKSLSKRQNVIKDAIDDRYRGSYDRFVKAIQR